MKEVVDKSKVRRTGGMVVQTRGNEEASLHTLHTRSRVLMPYTCIVSEII